ncbi:MAG: CPBP family intramembrane metalloprotease [Deltaproteobacteria bacterium]|nr:CPBP family intramembrane metalloprotease [Deltaproteobacteria bacterium]MBW2384990.1 CPBP family intramembrane metalloprotease [Deltaproteobacteria bacterium]
MEPEELGLEGPVKGSDGQRRGGADLVRIGLYFYAAMMAAALLWRMGFYGESILHATAGGSTADIRWGRDALIGAVSGLAVVAISAAMTRLTHWGEALARALGSSLGELSFRDALLLACASGLGEELFFRAALQPRVGLLWASLIFGAAHFVPRREMLPWSVFAVAAGLLFGVLFEWTGNVVAPIVAHALVNAVNLPLLVRDYGREPDS